MKNLVRIGAASLLAFVAFGSFALFCREQQPVEPASTSSTAHAGAAVPSTAVVSNDTTGGAIVFLSFGSDSAVLPSSPGWSFCTMPDASPLNCSFLLGAGAQQALPTGGAYLNATIAFNAPVGCGATKAELNLNNPAWYDTMDVSLVDGFSNVVAIDVVNDADGGQTMLGPPNGKTGNEKVYGLFPYGCDICVARQAPPCGIAKGTDGCKSGTQNDPSVVCQFQGATMSGGSAVTVRLLAGIPAR